MTYDRQRAALRSDNSSGFKGVTRAGAKWQASIRRNGRPLHLGLHSTPEAAAHAYDEAALELYGPGAWTNADHVAGLTPNPDGVRDADPTPNTAAGAKSAPLPPNDNEGTTP